MGKNVLFISPTGTLDNGAEISITNLMKYLSLKNYSIYNVIPYINHQKQNEYIQFCNENNINVLRIPVLKWWWEEAPGGFPGTKDERQAMYSANIREIRKYIHDYHIDLVITNTVNIFQGAVAAKMESKPHYWLIHEFPREEFSYYKDKIDFIDKFSDKIFAVEGPLHECVKQMFENKKVESFMSYTDIIPCVREDLLNTSPNKYRIVNVGRITDNKNQIEILKAYSKIKNISEIVLIGGWDVEYKKLIDQYILENNLSNITFIGNSDNPWQYLKKNDICVLSSKMETFGLVYLEAAINAIPIVASNTPGYKHIKKKFDIGNLYESGNVNDLIDCINHIVENYEDYYFNAKQKSTEIQDNFTQEKSYEKIINLIFSNDYKSSDFLSPINFLFDSNNSKPLIKFKTYRFYKRGLNYLKRHLKKR